jgi:hypothetical protein
MRQLAGAVHSSISPIQMDSTSVFDGKAQLERGINQRWPRRTRGAESRSTVDGKCHLALLVWFFVCSFGSWVVVSGEITPSQHVVESFAS